MAPRARQTRGGSSSKPKKALLFRDFRRVEFADGSNAKFECPRCLEQLCRTSATVHARDGSCRPVKRQKTQPQDSQAQPGARGDLLDAEYQGYVGLLSDTAWDMPADAAQASGIRDVVMVRKPP